MTTRILPEAEWPRLAETEAGTVWPHLNPAKAQIVVVEKDGQIVGCQIVMTVRHIEALWIAPAFRTRGSVARRLWEAVKRVAREDGTTEVMTTACDDRVRGLLAHVGATRLDGDHYLVSVEA
jgi:N-acetylglutamate synthase-like GNAT family acetyltransferase